MFLTYLLFPSLSLGESCCCLSISHLSNVFFVASSLCICILLVASSIHAICAVKLLSRQFCIGKSKVLSCRGMCIRAWLAYSEWIIAVNISLVHNIPFYCNISLVHNIPFYYNISLVHNIPFYYNIRTYLLLQYIISQQSTTYLFIEIYHLSTTYLFITIYH